MTLTDFARKFNLKHIVGSHVGGWDMHRDDGVIVMQGWSSGKTAMPLSGVAGALFAFEVSDEDWNEAHATAQRNGIAGRRIAIEAVRAGNSKVWMAISNCPADKEGPGAWAKHADLSRVFPVLAVFEQGRKTIAVVGRPVESSVALLTTPKA